VIVIPQYLNDYFDLLEKREGIKLEIGQKRWYTHKYKELGEAICQEYPSTPDESFMGSTEGFWYLKEFADVREAGQITNVLHQPQLLTYTAWDIGYGDNTSIWFYQLMPSGNVHIIDYYENNAEGLSHYVEVINEKRYTYGVHYFPHDAAAHEKGSGLSYETQAKDLGLDVKVLMRYNPSKTTFQAEVQRVRNLLKRCWFDEARCAIGIKHLESYQKKWNESMGHYTSEPVHNIHSHCADAFRYLAQAVEVKARKATVDKMEAEREYIRVARRRRI